MPHEELSQKLGRFYREMDERIKPLSAKEQQQYFEGVFHACSAIIKYAHGDSLGPFDTVDYIDYAMSRAYQVAKELRLDTETRMDGLLKSSMGALLRAFVSAEELHRQKGLSLDEEQEQRLDTLKYLHASKQIKTDDDL